MAEKEYIERDSVLRSLAVLLQMPFTGLDDAWEVAQKTPAADVVEVRHGRWLYVSGSGRYAEYECSECRAHVCFDERIDGTIPRYKGCPHCLAKMDGKK